jgi:hypothetical protein
MKAKQQKIKQFIIFFFKKKNNNAKKFQDAMKMEREIGIQVNIVLI